MYPSAVPGHFLRPPILRFGGNNLPMGLRSPSVPTAGSFSPPGVALPRTPRASPGCPPPRDLQVFSFPPKALLTGWARRARVAPRAPSSVPVLGISPPAPSAASPGAVWLSFPGHAHRPCHLVQSVQTSSSRRRGGRQAREQEPSSGHDPLSLPKPHPEGTAAATPKCFLQKPSPGGRPVTLRGLTPGWSP